MKIELKYVLVLLFSILLYQHKAQAQQDLISVLPINPSDKDSIDILYDFYLPNYYYISDSHSINGSNINIQLCIAPTGLAFPLRRKDTFQVGLLSAGQYHINFNIIFSDYSSFCNPYDTTILLDSFTVVSSVSIQEYNLLENINIYPNPVKNNLTIETKDDIQLIDFTIQNIEGKTIQIDSPSTFDSHSLILNMDSLHAGMYILILQTNEGILRHKFVMQ